MVEALARQGEDVLLLCQDPRFDKYPFVSRAFSYDKNGKRRLELDRPSPQRGTVHMHKPYIGNRIPVFVEDNYEGFVTSVPVTALSEAEWETYIQAHLKVLPELVKEYKIDCLVVNHAALLSVVAQRLQETLGVPFAVVPHGSDLEYAVRRDPRLHKVTEEALGKAARLFVVSPEIRDRLKEIYPARPDLLAKTEMLSVGVDTNLFSPVPEKERAEKFQSLAAKLKKLPTGKDPANERPAQSLLTQLPKPARYLGWLRSAGAYEGKRIEKGAANSLWAVPWGKAPVAAFVGRLIAAKGLQNLVAAAPLLWKANPLLNIVVVGHGPLREVAELLLAALKSGNVPWAEAIAQWGSPTEGENGERYFRLADYFQALKAKGSWDDYWHAATTAPIEQCHFTGYLDHDTLARLLPLTDCALFPSVVPEAGPMVLLEAASCGSFPMGTNQAGMAHNLTKLFEGLPTDHAAAARLPTSPAENVAAIARNIPTALKLKSAAASQLRANCVRHFDWSSLATQLLRALANTRRRAA